MGGEHLKPIFPIWTPLGSAPSDTFPPILAEGRVEFQVARQFSRPILLRSHGDALGYGDERPSAKSQKAQPHNSRFGLASFCRSESRFWRAKLRRLVLKRRELFLLDGRECGDHMVEGGLECLPIGFCTTADDGELVVPVEDSCVISVD